MNEERRMSSVNRPQTKWNEKKRNQLISSVNP